MQISPEALREIIKTLKAQEKVDGLQYGYGEVESYGEGFNDGLDEAIDLINDILKENEKWNAILK